MGMLAALLAAMPACNGEPAPFDPCWRGRLNWTAASCCRAMSRAWLHQQQLWSRQGTDPGRRGGSGALPPAPGAGHLGQHQTAGGATGEARAAYLPTLNAGASRYRDGISAEQGSSTRSVGTLYATLTWRLLDFGGRSANQRAADVLLQAASASQDATLQKAMAAGRPVLRGAQCAGGRAGA
jgi:outer membrane protein